jgi:hypothetical protein
MRPLLAAALIALAPVARADGCAALRVVSAEPHPAYAGVSVVRVESRAERAVNFRLSRGGRASPPLTLRPRESGEFLARLGAGDAAPLLVGCRAG